MPAYEELIAAPQPRAGIRERLGALARELAGRRIVHESTDGAVQVTVTADGALVDIAVTESALRTSHPEEVGPAIVRAVRDARAEAARFARERTRSVHEPDAAAAPVLQPGPPAAAMPPRRRRRPVYEDEVDLFQGFRR